MLNNLFSNIGQKIKNFAKAYFAIGAVLGILASFIMFMYGIIEGDEVFILIGLCAIIVWPIMVYITSIFLYGFGQLVNNSDKLANGQAASDANAPAGQSAEAASIEELKKLKSLLDQGIITEEEFQQAKEKLLK